MNKGMDGHTTGTVLSVSKQWWMKVNTKPIRAHLLDGATFPHVITVQYTVGDRAYTKRKWINAGQPVPQIGASVAVSYNTSKPKKARIL